MCQKRVTADANPRRSRIEAKRRVPFPGPFADGASRTRTGDLLGAITAQPFATVRHPSPPLSGRRVPGLIVSPSFAVPRHRNLTKNLTTACPARIARVRAKTPVRCSRSRALTFGQLLADDPKLSLAVLETVAARLAGQG